MKTSKLSLVLSKPPALPFQPLIPKLLGNILRKLALNPNLVPIKALNNRTLPLFPTTTPMHTLRISTMDRLIAPVMFHNLS